MAPLHLALVFAGAFGCAACVRGGGRAAADSPHLVPSASPTAIAASEPAAAPQRVSAEIAPGGWLTTAQARKYMLKLINRDRGTAGLAPVELDEGPPTRAGQTHAEDMARNGYLGHWGTDGSVPEQRFTEAGGTDMVLENSSCFTDERVRTLARGPRIDPRNIERAEEMFFHEQPPHDGHRRNILDPRHRKVGIGVAQPVATPAEIPVPCFAQEFVDPYGSYAPVPKNMRVGQILHVKGTVAAPAAFAGVGLARIESPAPIEVAELNQRRSYAVPQPYQMFWPPGYQTPIAVMVTGSHFEVDLPVSDNGRAGLYELSVWARFPDTPDLAMVSLRTFRVR